MMQGWLRMERGFTSDKRVLALSYPARWLLVRALVTGIDTDHRGLIPDFLTNLAWIRCDAHDRPNASETPPDPWHVTDAALAAFEQPPPCVCDDLSAERERWEAGHQELVDAGLWVRIADTHPSRYMFLDTVGCSGWNGSENSYGIDKALAQELFAAAHNCGRCGNPLNEWTTKNPNPKSDKTIDHIIPRSRGGTDDRENLRVICRSCNSSKGARL